VTTIIRASCPEPRPRASHVQEYRAETISTARYCHIPSIYIQPSPVPSSAKLVRQLQPLVYRANLSASYDKPPLFDVTIEEFETCALERLRVLAEIESSAARNRTWEESKTAIRAQAEKHLVLKQNSAKYDDLDGQRRKDHLSHFVLRLAFCRSYVQVIPSLSGQPPTLTL
jgi:hypothetical protein